MVIAIVVLALLGVVGFFVWQDHQSVPSGPSPITVRVPVSETGTGGGKTGLKDVVVPNDFPTTAPRTVPRTPLDQLLLDAATSKDIGVLTNALNSPFPEVLKRAVINLTAQDSTPDHRLGLMIDGFTQDKYATKEFFDGLNTVAQFEIKNAILSNAGDQGQLLAKLGQNPKLRYDGNGTFSAL